MTQDTNIENLFKEWGMAQTQMPANGDKLKLSVMQNLEAAKTPAVHNNFLMRLWLPWALVAIGVLVFFISTQDTQTHTYSKITTLPKTTTQQSHGNLSGLNSAPPEMESQRSQSLSISPSLDMSSGVSNDNKAYLKTVPQAPQPTTVAGNDSREYLKTDYSGNFQTRHVAELSDRLEIIIKGFGGRIDSFNTSDDSTFLSFVIPADKLEAFKAQAKGSVNYRFYSEQEQSQNLLPQKRDMEQRQTQTNDNLNEVTNGKAQLTQNHNRVASSYKSQISSLNTQLTQLQNEYTTDPSRAYQIQQQIEGLQKQISKLQTQLAGENSEYSAQLESYDLQIKSYQAQLGNLDTQTTDLLDNVATVNGNIFITKINWWQTFNAYCPPGYWVTAWILFVAITTYLTLRKQSRMTIP